MATIQVVAPGAGTPTGIVTFLNGATTLGTIELDGSGQAFLNTNTLSVGAHSITARYSGDTTFNPSGSTALAETIDKAATRTTVTASATPAILGDTVTLTAAVEIVPPGTAVPTGTVTFLRGPTVLGTATLNASQQATLTTVARPIGPYAIVARYT